MAFYYYVLLDSTLFSMAALIIKTRQSIKMTYLDISTTKGLVEGGSAAAVSAKQCMVSLRSDTDGEDASAPEFQKRLDMLRATGDPIFFRLDEITTRPAASEQARGYLSEIQQVNMVDWFKGMITSGRGEEAVDRLIEVQPSSRSLRWALRVCLCYLDLDASKRPKVGQVLVQF